MKKIRLFFFMIVWGALATLTGCDNFTPSTSSTIPPTPDAMLEITGAFALVKTSLEFYRNGKTYEIVVGIDEGNSFTRATPHPGLLKQIQSNGGRGTYEAYLVQYGDFDNDGEIEFIVSLKYPGPYPVEMVRIYEYSLIDDEYYVADEFGGKDSVLKWYGDMDEDGNPEFVTRGHGFCYVCSITLRGFSAISIMRYEEGKFKNVVREFPDLVEDDMEYFLELLTNNQNEDYIMTVLPSYLYDMYLLGRVEESRLVFDNICATTIKPSRSIDFDCAEYRTDVESAIRAYDE